MKKRINLRGNGQILIQNFSSLIFVQNNNKNWANPIHVSKSYMFGEQVRRVRYWFCDPWCRLTSARLCGHRACSCEQKLALSFPITKKMHRSFQQKESFPFFLHLPILVSFICDRRLDLMLPYLPRRHIRHHIHFIR